MLIKIGFDISLRLTVPAAVLFALRVHPSRAGDLIDGEHLEIEPALPLDEYTDLYGNHCGRVSAPAGLIRFTNHALIRDSGQPDAYAPEARQTPVSDLPVEALPYLLPSRYCESDTELLPIAWNLFGGIPEGWARVQAICGFVHNHLKFDYLQARVNRTAVEAYRERVGVCRDFTHLAITFCRCMNIPAAYATGYLGDIGVPPVPDPMDFSAWFEVFLDGRWYTFDARHNRRRIGRIVMARGRDAADAALTTVFSKHLLENFQVATEEVPELAPVPLHSVRSRPLNPKS